jgi:hypothetical protein
MKMSAEIQKLNREAVKLDPESHFDSPYALIEEVGLTRGEKLATLERWADQVDRRLDSGSEGMPSHGTEARDAELLREIGLVKQKLEDEKA